MMEYNEIIKLLEENSDEGYKLFHTKLEGVGNSYMYGVRVPTLRGIAKDIGRKDPLNFLDNIKFDSYEGKMLYGMVVERLHCDISEKLRLFDIFVDNIDSWAICDIVAFKVNKKDKPIMWEYLLQCFASEDEFRIRFAVINAMRNFFDEAYIDRVLEAYKSINANFYYVDMGIAWGIQTAFIKYPEKIYKLFDQGDISQVVINKAIQKIRDSKRVAKSDKEKVLNYKRKIENR